MALLQVCLWLCGGHGENGCVTVITNLAKVRENKQSRKSWNDQMMALSSCLQLYTAQVILLKPIDSMQAIEFQCISDEMGKKDNLPEHSNGLPSRCSVKVTGDKCFGKL